MSSVGKTLQIRSSPHVRSGARVDRIMFHVVLALLPTAAFGVWAFGLAAGLTLAMAVLSCVVTEHVLCRVNRQRTTVRDWSAVITGLLYGLTLPPSIPLWMTFVGGVIAIALGKYAFGGLGSNPFNPALVGRAVLQAAFPVSMTTWMASGATDRFSHVPGSVLTLPLLAPQYDALSGPTPLSGWKFDHVLLPTGDLLLGFTSGSLGETSAVLILLGGVYLAVRGMMNWRIPVAILVTVAGFAGVLHLGDPQHYAPASFMLLSGGLMLGAVFMATDMVVSPITHLGSVVYGVLIGVLVVLIRVWGGLPEGVMYAILLANAVAPHIDRLVHTRVYGTRRRVV